VATFSAYSVVGAKELQKALSQLDYKVRKRGIRSSVLKGLRVLVKSGKKKIPPKYKAAKRLMNYRLAKDRAGVLQAKWGVGVGKRKKVSSKGVDRDPNRPGMGITPETVHWLFIGTGERFHKSGHPTGRMAPILKDVIRNTMADTGDIAVGVIAKGVYDFIDREANKTRK
jgi:hypothetical protein